MADEQEPQESPPTTEEQSSPAPENPPPQEPSAGEALNKKLASIRSGLAKTFLLTGVELTEVLKVISAKYEVTIPDLRATRKAMMAALEEKVRAKAEETKKEADAGMTKPVIHVSCDLSTMHGEAIQALAKDARIYRLGETPHARLVCVEGRKTDLISDHMLPEYLTDAAIWIDTKHQATTPDQRTVMAINKRGKYPEVRELKAIVTRPTLLPSGAVLMTPGYDPESKLFYAPDADAKWGEMPELPTTQEALRASARKSLDLLDDVVIDFPFKAALDKAVWLGLVLTIETRLFITECFPMFVLSANVKGGGKGLLGSAAGWIGDGKEVPTQQLPSGRGENAVELEKRLTGIVIANPALIFFDEVETIKSQVLQMVATNRHYAGRVLGETRYFEGRCDSVFFFAGNNVNVGGDMTRRVLECKLSSPYENPAVERTPEKHPEDYKHPERAGQGGTFSTWIKESANDLHLAALNVVRCFLASQKMADKPSIVCGSLGKYEAWSGLVPLMLAWLGEGDITTAIAGDEDDSEVDNQSRLLKAWYAAFGNAEVSPTVAVNYMRDFSLVPDTTKKWRANKARMATNGDPFHAEDAVRTYKDSDLADELKTAWGASIRIETKDGVPKPEQVGWMGKRLDMRRFGNLRLARRRDKALSTWFIHVEDVTAAESTVEHGQVPKPDTPKAGDDHTDMLEGV
jgi:hypothetical protein